MAQMAERVGFEPTVGFPTLAFQASTFGHSVIPPKTFQTVFGTEVAEEAGFEPAVGFPTMDFESTAFVHSATPPKDHFFFRTFRKKARSVSAASSDRIPAVTSKRWFNTGWLERSPKVPRNPPRGSAAA
jgi:hypothetical protein